MNTETDRKHEILERFRSFHRRYTRNQRWGLLLSGLIVVFTLWICVRLTGEVLLFPGIAYVANAILVIGIVSTLIMVYRKTLDRRTAAYVFDRFHGLDGTFLTLQSLQSSAEGTGEREHMEAALEHRIRGRLTKRCLPAPTFPTTRALACLLLLIIGTGLPYAVYTRSPGAPDGVVNHQSTKSGGLDGENASGTTNRMASAGNSNVESESESIMEREKQLKSERAIDDTDRKNRKRPDTQGDMGSPLAKDGPGSSDRVEGSTPSQQNGGEATSATSSSDTGDGTPGGAAKGESRGTDPHSGSEPVPGSRERGQELTTDQSSRDQEIPNVAATSSKNNGSIGESRPAPGGTQVLDETFIAGSIQTKNSGSYQVNWSQLQQALQRPHGVQTWHPRYDRSISTYRSFLASFISSKDQKHVSDE